MKLDDLKVRITLKMKSVKMDLDGFGWIVDIIRIT